MKNEIFALIKYLIIFILCISSIDSFGQTTVYCRPSDQTNMTGTVNNLNIKTSGEIKAGDPFNRRGWARFNILSIPNSAIIETITLQFYVNSASGSDHDLVIRHVPSNPLTENASTLNSEISTGTWLGQCYGCCSSTGYKIISLNSNSVNLLQTNVTNNTGWFAIGFWEWDDDANNASIDGYDRGGTPEPILIITYTIPQVFEVYNAWWEGSIDNDGDNYTQYRKLYFDVDVSSGTNEIWAKIWKEKIDGASGAWYKETGDFTITGNESGDMQYIEVGLPNNELSYGSYNFGIQIYDSETNETLALYDWDDDTDLNNEKFETQLEDTPCTTPGTPSANTPTSITTSGANFSWSSGSPAGSSTVTYYWAVGTSSNVTYESGYTDRGTTTNTSANTSSLNPSTTYFLKLKAQTSCDGTSSAYSSNRQFTTDTDCTTPGTPNANTPTSGTTNANFSWSSGSPTGSPTVTYYWAVGTSTNVTYESGYTDRGTTTGTTANTNALNPSTAYYLRLKAQTSCDGTSSSYSTYKQFVTNNVCTTPGTPTTNAPASITATGANFSWLSGSPIGSSTITYYWAVGTSTNVTYESGYTDRGSTTNTSANTNSLNPSTAYYLRLKAQTSCDGTSSGYSAYKQFLTENDCTTPASNVADNSGTGSVTMTCTASGGSGGSYLYKWYSGTSCSGTVISTSSSYIASASGYYACKVYIDGCIESTYFDCDYGYATIGAVGIEDTEKLNSINIYPNPTYGTIRFESSIEIDNIEIYDMLGTLVFKSRFNSELDISNLNEGVYLLKLYTEKDKAIMTHKIFLNK